MVSRTAPARPETGLDSAPLWSVTVRGMFSHGPGEVPQALRLPFGGRPSPLKRQPGLVSEYAWKPRLYPFIELQVNLSKKW